MYACSTLSNAGAGLSDMAELDMGKLPHAELACRGSAMSQSIKVADGGLTKSGEPRLVQVAFFLLVHWQHTRNKSTDSDGFRYMQRSSVLLRPKM